MPVASAEIWRILYAVSRYLLPVLAVVLFLLVLFYSLSDSHMRHETIRSLPGSGTVGELIVLSGDRNLEPNTWFPVPREGVLGSVRSCDLVVPCPGVRSKHLDFSWEDGVGLLIRPRTGCEAQINGIPVTCRTDAKEIPLLHGSVLQVGSAVLRLHLFAALDNTTAPFRQQAAAGAPFSSQPPVSEPVFFEMPYHQITGPAAPEPEIQFSESLPVPENSAVLPETRRPASPRRSDRWKEDLGE